MNNIGLPTHCEALGPPSWGPSTPPLLDVVVKMEEVQVKLVLHIGDRKEEVKSLKIVTIVYVKILDNSYFIAILAIKWLK